MPHTSRPGLFWETLERRDFSMNKATTSKSHTIDASLMGNSAGSRSARAVVGSDGRPTMGKDKRSGIKSFRSLDSKSVPLVILKDQASQTEDSTTIRTVKAIRKFNYSRALIYSFIAYLSLCVIVGLSPFVQSILIYLNVLRFPSGDLTDVQRFGLFNTRNINFTTADGLVLRGYHLLPSQAIWTANVSAPPSENDFDQLLRGAERVILYFHGNAGSRAAPFRLRSIKQMSYFLNAHVLAFDYRGFGDSQGWPSEEGTYKDGLAAVAWYLHRIQRLSTTTFPTQYLPSAELSKHRTWFTKSKCTDYEHLSLVPSEKNCSTLTKRSGPFLYLYGQSLGTGISTEVAMRMNKHSPGSIAGLILDAPFSTARSGASTHPVGAILRIFPFIRDSLMAMLHIKYDTVSKIMNVDAPILLLHGLLDFKVPAFNSEHLLKALLDSGRYFSTNYSHTIPQIVTEACPQLPVQYKAFEGANHNNVHEASDYVAVMAHFFKYVEMQ